ncbi:putative general amino-acid permease GAP1 [Mytilinidion resinicola]|uniref:General amino-acid permease GAP1 n=1 Tax=Mytilinidion resinicola TaxID=574789 RepID=A0A6A6Z6I3_9PEZI|nr:putative general amino-acid permease GAP1 [Mytilinidion resinicola]KAF2815904.1 putative general amino-acid permease GAP1 [Mytilinidion resinicola]
MAITEPAPTYHSDAKNIDLEKDAAIGEVHSPTLGSDDIADDRAKNPLKRNLHGRHMQMIAIGGAIGAGLFVGSGGALRSGGPASLVICFMIIGVSILMMMQALGELAIMYPVNGAFFQYICRFIDPSWGFAMGWDYAIQWLTILPFEITAAGLTIDYWHHYNIGIWIAVFLTVLTAIQFFGVRGYGEVEFLLSTIKVVACAGFIIFGIIVNCGGVPTDNRGYIGARYWHSPEQAFRNGFHGFCTVFVTASFAFGGTELTGLAAAESADPVRDLPKATKQVFWRITFFYVVNLFILGLIVPSSSQVLLGSSGANTKASPFVLAITLAGVKGLPSVFNAVITISVISVANSATYASTRTIQALAQKGMAPKFLAYVDKKGRPIPTIVLQLVLALLAFCNEQTNSQVFTWLLALSGVANFFVYGSICVAHIRFRSAWKLHGHTVEELPFRAQFGIWGSYLGVLLNFLCLAAQFYTALYPIGGTPNAEAFFEAYLAAPLIIALYLGWKIWSMFMIPENRPMWVAIKDIDLYTGMREDQFTFSAEGVPEAIRRQSIASLPINKPKKWYDYPKNFLTGLF